MKFTPPPTPSKSCVSLRPLQSIRRIPIFEKIKVDKKFACAFSVNLNLKVREILTKSCLFDKLKFRIFRFSASYRHHNRFRTSELPNDTIIDNTSNKNINSAVQNSCIILLNSKLKTRNSETLYFRQVAETEVFVVSNSASARRKIGSLALFIFA